METTPCPKCQQAIPIDAVECPFCGIIVAKFREASARAANGPSSAAPPGALGTSAGLSPPADPPGVQRADPVADPVGEGLYDPTAPPAFPGRAAVAAMGSHGPVTDTMLVRLEKTGSWVLFISVVFFLLALLVVLAAVGLLVGAGAAGLPGISPMVLFVPYALLGVVYLVMALILFNFSQSARQAGRGGGTEAIEEALRYQLLYWRIVGIFLLVGIGLAGLSVLLGLLGALARGA